MPLERSPARDTEHILIYGAGAVGSLLGGLLAAGGSRVTLLGRAALAESVAARGLIIQHAPGEQTIALDVITDLAALPRPVDLVLLTTKAYAVEPAAVDLARLGAEGAAIVALQNGVGADACLRASPEIRRLAAGSVTVSVSTPRPGVVRQETRDGGVTLAPVRGDAPLDRLESALRAGGLPVSQVGDAGAMRWSKLLLNMLGNATAAILALPPEAIFRDARLFQLERAAFLEALAVMRALGARPVALPGYDVPRLTQAMRLPRPLARRLLAERIARGRGDKRPSLWLDVDAGRGDTEVDWLNGAVASVGATAGVSTPINDALTGLVTAITADPERRRDFAGQPVALLEYLRRARP